MNTCIRKEWWTTQWLLTCPLNTLVTQQRPSHYSSHSGKGKGTFTHWMDEEGIWWEVNLKGFRTAGRSVAVSRVLWRVPFEHAMGKGLTVGGQSSHVPAVKPLQTKITDEKSLKWRCHIILKHRLVSFSKVFSKYDICCLDWRNTLFFSPGGNKDSN